MLLTQSGDGANDEFVSFDFYQSTDRKNAHRLTCLAGSFAKGKFCRIKPDRQFANFTRRTSKRLDVQSGVIAVDGHAIRSGEKLSIHARTLFARHCREI